MRLTTILLALTVVSAWSFCPGWAQVAGGPPSSMVVKEIKGTAVPDHGTLEEPGGTHHGIGPLCQMGGGMMGGRGEGYCGPGMMGPGPQQSAPGSSSGADLFNNFCAVCHPGGGNNIVPDLPIRGSAQLYDFDTFRAYVRYPTMPDGARGRMPGFSSRQISDQQMLELYRHLKSRFGK
jgi:mono/diheme cytochrome c family protein